MATVWRDVARAEVPVRGGFERLLGRQAWLALPDAVRERFLRRIETGDCVRCANAAFPLPGGCSRNWRGS